MRARRAETPARPRGDRGIARKHGATAARRGWAQSYRALPRAQPGPERSGGTRPHQPLTLTLPSPSTLPLPSPLPAAAPDRASPNALPRLHNDPQPRRDGGGAAGNQRNEPSGPAAPAPLDQGTRRHADGAQ